MQNIIDNMEKLCKCGCGSVVTSKKKSSLFIHGHGRRGLKWSEEDKKRIGNQHRGKVLSEESKQKLRNLYLGTTLSEKHKQKISESMKGMPGRPHTEETKKKISAIKKQQWADGVFDSSAVNYSSYETKLEPVVAKLGYKSTIKKRFYIKGANKTRVPDFYNSDTKKIIEIFGEYWHRDRILPNGKKHETPGEVIAWYAALGWDCTVVWAKEEFDEFYRQMEERVEEPSA